LKFVRVGSRFALLLGLLLSQPAMTLAEGTGLFSQAGLRVGINDDENEEDFTQVQVFGVIPLPWRSQGGGWFLNTMLQGTIAALHAGGDTGAVFTLGPGIEFGPESVPFTISLGLNPSVATKHNYGDEDLGGWFYFTSYLGFNYRFGEHLGLGFQASHMSNAGFNDRNPGVNIFAAELSYRF